MLGHGVQLWPSPPTRRLAGRSSKRCPIRSARWTRSAQRTDGRRRPSPGGTRSAASSPRASSSAIPAGSPRRSPCAGVLSGGVATWNTALDSAFAFQQLLAAGIGLQVVDITNPTVNLDNATAEAAAAAAQGTPAGQARLALAAALGDTPGWFTPRAVGRAVRHGLLPRRRPTRYLWDTEVDFPVAFDFRANLEQDAGGNPSWNTGVNFAAQLRKSADRREVVRAVQGGRSLSHGAGRHRPLSRTPRGSAPTRGRSPISPATSASTAASRCRF